MGLFLDDFLENPIVRKFPQLYFAPANSAFRNRFFLPFSMNERTIRDMKKGYSTISNAHYTLKVGQRHTRWYVPYFLVKILCSVLTPLLTTITSTVVVYALSQGFDNQQYLWTILALSGALLVSGLLQALVDERYEWLSTFARSETAWADLMKKVLSTDYPNIEIREKRSVFTRGFAALDSNWVGIEGMMKQYPGFYVGIIGMAVYGVLTAIYVPWVLFILGGMLATNLLIGIWAYNFMVKTEQESEENYHRREILSDNATSKEYAKDVRSYRLQKWFLSLFDSLTKQVGALEFKSRVRFFLGSVSDSVFALARDLIAYSFLIGMAINQQIDISTFVFLTGIVAGFSSWVNSFTVSFNNMRRFGVAVGQFREALNLPDPKKESTRDISKLQKPIAITLEHVCFTYPGSDHEILHDISLSVKPGERIALVGDNGAGKTTLVKLLAGLYAPTSGRILINGIDAQEFSRDDYFALVSPVFQDSQPLAFTVFNNVACTDKEEGNLAAFWSAVSKAGLKEKVESLPQKEDTYITQTFDLSGVRLSGGETQKLMLARSLYKGAPILLLDEPTAALDPLSEQAMYEQYLSFSKNNTSFFISHRLASTRFCDRILYLSHGEIKESGTHESLLKQGGLYAETFKIQAKYYQEAPDGNIQ